MIIRNLVGESGKTIISYVAENDEDREEIARMMMDGEIPNAPAQAVPQDAPPPGEE